MTASGAERHVLFFGDSFVAGVGDPDGRGWVGRVAAASAAAGAALTAYPLGIRRETSVQVAARWRSETRPRVLEDADTRVVFSFGVNDAAVEDGRRRVEPERSAQVLARVLEEAAQLGLRAFVVGPPPACDAEHDARISLLSQRLHSVCARRAVPFAGVVDHLCATAIWAEEAAAGDGVHPAAGGYGALAQLVLAAGWLEWIR